jgi:hypothetical protein
MDHVRNQDSRLTKLIQGNPEEVEAVLYTSVVQLIAHFAHWGLSLPETMILDELRLKALSAYFHVDVVSSIILVTTTQKLREFVEDASERKRLVESVRDIVLEKPPKPTAPRHTINLLVDDLGNTLAPEHLAHVRAILEKNVKKKSAVYASMIKLFRSVWVHILLHPDKDLPASIVPDCVRFLLPGAKKRLEILSRIVRLNKSVHTHRYNDIIITAAKEAAEA